MRSAAGEIVRGVPVAVAGRADILGAYVYLPVAAASGAEAGLMSATARNQVFTAVHTIGGLLPADMLSASPRARTSPASKPADYQVVGARSVRDAAERHWDYLKRRLARAARRRSAMPSPDRPDRARRRELARYRCSTNSASAA